MKKKIFLIILLGVVFTFLIYRYHENDDIYLLSLGDGLASGMTAYNIDGYNYNDYLRDKLEESSRLKDYVHEFSMADMTVEKLITSIENNYQLEATNLTIQQALAKSNLVTVGIGIDELAMISVKQDIPNKELEDYKKDMETLLKLIKNFSNGNIYLIGLYKAYNMKEEDINDLNKFLKQSAENFKINYVEISDFPENPEYFLLDNSYYLNYKGHREIFERIQKNTNF